MGKKGRTGYNKVSRKRLLTKQQCVLCNEKEERYGKQICTE